jgi:hypothetical protein
VNDWHAIVDAGDRLDHEAIAEFQRRAFSDIRMPMDPASVQTPAYYAWKYRTPWGPARVATVTHEGDRASMVAAVPTLFACGSDRFIAWQICDIATAPKWRRRGLFRGGLAALLDDLPHDAPVFCLPNRNSRHLLPAMGFRDIGRLRVYVSTAALFTSGHESSQDGAAEAMIATDPREFRTFSDPAGIDWRFRRRPGVSYARIDVGDAAAIVRTLEQAGMRKLVVMRIWARDTAARARVLRAVRSYAHARRTPLVIYLDSAWAGSFMPPFLPVPATLLPRPLPLLARAFPSRPIRFDTADWDVL